MPSAKERRWALGILLGQEVVMRMDLTAAYRRVPEGGYVAGVDEIPSVLTQGDTLEEARANLADAVQLVIEAQRAQSAKLVRDEDVIRERISVDVPHPDFF